MKKPASPRLAVVDILNQVLDQDMTLSEALQQHGETLRDPRDQAFAKALCFETLRWLPRLQWILAQLLSKPLRHKDRKVSYGLLSGLAQMLVMRVPDHAAVSETVDLMRSLKRPWAASLANAVLRRCGREQDQLLEQARSQAVAHYAHPQWLMEAIRRSWPQHWTQILEQNNLHPPMSLRVRGEVDEYLQALAAAGIAGQAVGAVDSAVILAQAQDPVRLPGFSSGRVSVQDGAAQLAAGLLQLAPGQRVLDACAAPGGKTAHILDSQPDLAEVLALDSSSTRLQRLQDNLQRLGLSASVTCGDAGEPGSWWDGRPFQRILLDAPCSATGIIRRHPDIKTLRNPQQLQKLQATQARLLRNLWPALEPGGTLLYATCSILAEENQQQIDHFLAATADAQQDPIRQAWNSHSGPGLKILPGEQDMDGFFYARLRKR